MKYEDIQKVNAEMKFTDIGKGKEYAEVPQRVQAFRKLFPHGTIKTKILSCQNGVCVMQASILNGEELLATGTAYEKEGNGFVNKTSYIENCETSAVGRALAFLGLGSDKSIASYEEVANAKLQQKQPDKKDTKALIEQIEMLAKKNHIPLIDICQQAGVQLIEQMAVPQMENCIQWLKGL